MSRGSEIVDDDAEAVDIALLLLARKSVKVFIFINLVFGCHFRIVKSEYERLLHHMAAVVESPLHRLVNLDIVKLLVKILD